MHYRNIVIWNSPLSGFVHNEKYLETLALFASIAKSNLATDEVTLVNLLQICKVLENLHHYKSTHCRVTKINSISSPIEFEREAIIVSQRVWWDELFHFLPH